MDINRNFFLLWQGVLMRSLGTHFFIMVGVLWLVEVANSATLVGSLILALGIAAAVSTPLGGVLGDYLSRRNILLATDLCVGLAIFILILLFSLVDTFSWLIIGLFITYIIVGFGGGFFTPIVYAFMPDILHDKGLAKGNAIINTTTSISQMLGRALIGILFLWLGTQTVLMVIGAAFLYSAFTVLLIQLPESSNVLRAGERKSSVVHTEPLGGAVRGVLANFREGISYILADRGMAKAFLLRVGSIWCLSAFMVNAPFLVQFHFGQLSAWYGFLMASLSAGFVIGSFCVAKQFNQLTGLLSRIYLLKYALLLVPMFCLALILIESIYIALLLLFLQGINHSIIDITIITQIQATSPPKLRGRALSVFVLIGTIVSGISGFSIGLLIDATNKDVVFVQWVLGMVGCLLLYPLLFVKELFLFMRRVSAPVSTLYRGTDQSSVFSSSTSGKIPG